MMNFSQKEKEIINKEEALGKERKLLREKENSLIREKTNSRL